MGNEINWNEAQKAVHDYAVRKGFHGENEPSEIEYRCLIIEEILEAYRALMKALRLFISMLRVAKLTPSTTPKNTSNFS